MRVAGIEPASTDWKSATLTVRLYTQICLANGSDTIRQSLIAEAITVLNRISNYVDHVRFELLLNIANVSCLPLHYTTRDLLSWVSRAQTGDLYIPNVAFYPLNYYPIYVLYLKSYGFPFMYTQWDSNPRNPH